MYSGASLISLIRRASRVQSSSLIRPDRMSASLIFASADSSRMTISDLLISSEKMTLAMPVLDRARPQKVQPKRRVVRRNHRLAGQVHVVGVVDLDTAHGNAVDRADVDDEARTRARGAGAARDAPCAPWPFAADRRPRRRSRKFSVYAMLDDSLAALHALGRASGSDSRG